MIANFTVGSALPGIDRHAFFDARAAKAKCHASLERKWLASGAVAHQLHAQQQPEATRVTQDPMTLDQRAQAGQQLRAALGAPGRAAGGSRARPGRRPR